MKNPAYQPAHHARRQRLRWKLTVAWRLALAVSVNLSVWIGAEDSEHGEVVSDITFTPLLAEADPVGSQIQPKLAEEELETGKPESDTASDEEEATNIQSVEEVTVETESDELLDRVAVSKPEVPVMSFLRPDWTAATDRYRPSRESEKHSRKGLRIHVDTGYGYDSSTLPTESGRSSIERSGGVSWFEIGGSYDGDFSLADGAMLFYGSNFGAGLYSGEGDQLQDGSETVDGYLNPYIGLQGQKTVIQLDGYYDQFEGNDKSYKNSGRESLGSDGLRTGARIFGVRLFDHSAMEVAFDYKVEEFNNGDSFNDRESWVGDLGWLYKPSRLPKIEAGTGVRVGEYFTSFSPDLAFAEPSLRARYHFSPKTGFEGRVGYLFRDYQAEYSAPSDGDVVFAVTADWQASDRMHVQLQGYRDSSPSLQNVGEYYTATGVRTDVGYRMPFLRLHLMLSGAYEYADYNSATGLGDADRADDYFWFNTAVTRRLAVDWLANPSVSLFYNHREIASSQPNRDFTQDFGGVKMRFNF